jgi:hypothetical protein
MRPLRTKMGVDQQYPVIEQITALESSEVGSLEEFEAGMDALAEGSEQIPVLPPAAYSRESIYGAEA